MKEALLDRKWKPDAILLARLDRPYPDDPKLPPPDDPGGPPRPRGPGGPIDDGPKPIEIAKAGDHPPIDPNSGGQERPGPPTVGGEPKPAPQPPGGRGGAQPKAGDHPPIDPISGGQERPGPPTVGGEPKPAPQPPGGRGGAQPKAGERGTEERTKARPAGENVGDFSQLKTRFDEATKPSRPRAGGGGSGGIVKPSRPGGGRRFSLGLRIRPIFGGIMIGNEVSEAPKALGAKISLNKTLGAPVLEIKIEGEKGREDVRFEDMTSTELWCAYRFVQPDKLMTDRFDAQRGECGLVGMSGKLSGGWRFGIHPAVADTILARDAMRLDMAPAKPNPPIIKIPPEITWTNYQWSDTKSRIRAVHGNLRIEPADGPGDTLMRLRFWNDRRPGWWGPDTNLDQAISKELERRYSDRIVREGLDKSAEYLLPRIEERIEREVEAEWRAPELPDWYLKAADKDNARRDETERRVEIAVTEAGIVDAPSYLVPKLVKLANRSVIKELSAKELPDWYLNSPDRDKAPTQEIERRITSGLAKAGLTDSAPYVLPRIVQATTAAVREEARAHEAPAWLGPSDDDRDIRREVERRVTAEAKAKGLDASSAFRVRSLRSSIEGKLYDELEGDVGGLDEEALEDLFEEFDALRKIDRFARVVAVLNWLDHSGCMPDLPPEIQPERMDVPPEYLFQDVVIPKRPSP